MTSMHIIPMKQAKEMGLITRFQRIYEKNPTGLTTTSWFKFEVLLKNPRYLLAFIDQEPPFFVVFSTQSKHVETCYPPLSTSKQANSFLKLLEKQGITNFLIPKPRNKVEEGLKDMFQVKPVMIKYSYTLTPELRHENMFTSKKTYDIQMTLREIESSRGKGINEVDSFVDYLMNTPNLAENAITIMNTSEFMGYVIPQHDPHVREGYLDWIYYSQNNHEKAKHLIQESMLALFHEGVETITVTVQIENTFLRDILESLYPTAAQVFLQGSKKQENEGN